jgi:hypothetical protein
MPRVLYRNRRDPVEDTLLSGQLREQHHARKEEIYIGSFADGMCCQPNRNEPQNEQQQRPPANPVHLSHAAWAQQHQQNACGDDRDKKTVHHDQRHSELFLHRVPWRFQKES